MPADPRENPRKSLQILLEACLLLSSKLDLPELLKAILSLASRIVEAEAASLLLLDPAAQELYFDVALGLDPEVSKIRLKIGQGIAGTVALEGKPVIIADARRDPRWNPAVDRRSGFVTRSILAAPMTIKGRLIGVVEAINRLGGPFSDADRRIFEAFCSQAAVAIENARLFASLNEEKAKLDAAFSQMRDGVVLAGEEGRILLANPAANRLLGLGDAPAGSLSDALRAVKLHPPLERLAAPSPEPLAFEIVRDKPKKLVLAGAASSFKFEAVGSRPASVGRFLVFRDVTEERQEELLKRSFLSLVSHKLKTPLASITGFSEVLLSESDLPPMTRKPIETICSQGKKLTELVEKLLAFTTLEGLDPQQLQQKPFDLGVAVSDALSGLGSWLAGQKAQVVVELAPGSTVFGDFSLIRGALKHLIENGVKFNPKPEKKLRVCSAIQDGFVVVRVEDDGPGIPPEDLERVLSKFHQVESSFTGQVEGAGLGLPFVKKVAEFHGGRLWLESKLSQGTAAAFTLPRPPGIR